MKIKDNVIKKIKWRTKLLVTKTVDVKLYRNTIIHYRDKGYPVGTTGDMLFNVRVEDLMKNSNVKVDLICDFCNSPYSAKYGKYLSSRDSGNCCYGCRSKKVKAVNMNKYGIENTSQLPETQEKRKNTCLKKYGAVSNLCLKETKDRIKKTNLEKYGFEYSAQSQEGKDKRKETNLRKYGSENVMGNEEIKNKMRKSMYENGTCACSKAQRYLSILLKGELNYPFGYYNVDIYFPKLNVYIEYDGSGHNLNVRTGNITQEQFKRKQRKRYNYLKKQNLKIIRMINMTDKLPSDKILHGIFKESISKLKKKDVYFTVVDLDKYIK